MILSVWLRKISVVILETQVANGDLRLIERYFMTGYYDMDMKKNNNDDEMKHNIHALAKVANINSSIGEHISTMTCGTIRIINQSVTCSNQCSATMYVPIVNSGVCWITYLPSFEGPSKNFPFNRRSISPSNSDMVMICYTKKRQSFSDTHRHFSRRSDLLHHTPINQIYFKKEEKKKKKKATSSWFNNH
jgi:hypothetical protein